MSQKFMNRDENSIELPKKQSVILA